MIAIIDYGAGNLRSVANALMKVGYSPVITTDPAVVVTADAVIFPGVGAATSAMQSLKKTGMGEVIRQLVELNKPVFAICLGLQILLEYTEEGGHSTCLGVIPGDVKKLPAGLKVPHMGWNQVKQTVKHPLFKDIPDTANFYFVHSYYANPFDRSIVAATTNYGVTFCSVLIRGNLIATQFHPEKSGEYGLKMYANFLKLALGK
jgi:glutamine amidotransferase